MSWWNSITHKTLQLCQFAVVAYKLASVWQVKKEIILHLMNSCRSKLLYVTLYLYLDIRIRCSCSVLIDFKVTTIKTVLSCDELGRLCFSATFAWFFKPVQLCLLEICFLSMLRQCHWQSQIFPVSFADFVISGVLVSFIVFIFEGKCPFWLWEVSVLVNIRYVS